ncbi:MAG: HAD-IA family hydrolase, partial [Thermoplasmata archaeon]|nr:HAD-IA family hydrolase [Thermoplasmata archaeon]
MTIDLWHTLIAFSRAGPRKYERARRAAWVDPLVAHGLPRRAAETDVRAMEEWASRREASGHSVSLAEQADEIERLVGVRPAPDRVGHAIAFAIASASLRWSPGLRPALVRLRRRGLRLGVVSNILYEPPEAAHALLRRLGERRVFDAVVISSDGPDAKPSPGPIRRAADRLGVHPSELLHIGDGPADLVAAHRAGVAFVRFTGRPRLKLTEPLAPIPKVRYPSVGSWTELADDFDRLWFRASAARDRSLRRGRSGRGRPPRRATGRVA